MAFDKSQVEDIKQRLNIVDVIGEVVSLTKSGSNYLGRCPFHKEKTPSFSVAEDKQFYHCFGCGKSGDVYRFIQEYRQVSFAESLAILAEKAGVQLENTPQYTRPKRQDPNQALYDIHADAALFYQKVLTTTKVGEAARRYLYERGLDDEIIEHFGIGLAPDEADFFYRSLDGKYPEDVLLDSGLFSVSDSNRFYDSFRGRIMFPLSDDQGRVIAFSGRIWQENDTGAKYKNSRATKIFNKSYELYHLDSALASIKQAHEVYLMEGFMDVIAAYRSGITHAVASMGTALTKEHVAHLSRYTQQFILAYDGDNAGQAAIAKALDLLDNAKTQVVIFPAGMDPDEYAKKESPQALGDFLTQSQVSAVEFWMSYLKPDNIDNLQQEIHYVERLAPIIAQETSITAQNTYITLLADRLPDFTYRQVEDAVNNIRVANRSESRSAVNQQQAEPQEVVVNLPLSRQKTALERAESQMLYRMIHHPYLQNDYRLRDFHFETVNLERLYQLLISSGEITSSELSNEPEEVQDAYYRVLEENLPDQLAPDEMAHLERERERCLLQKDFRQEGKLLREKTNQGDKDGALAALERMIAQKRKME